MKDNQSKNGSQVRLVIVPFLIALVLVLGSSILITLFYDKFFSSSIEGNYNTFCQDYQSNVLQNQKDEDIDKELLNYQICKHPLKKKHFIWIHMDGLAYDQTKQVQTELSKDISIHKVVGPEYRQTGAMHESYFTGKPSMNLIAGEIQSDNFALQVQKSPQMKQVEMIGSLFPLFSLIPNYVEKQKIGNEYGIMKLMCGLKGENRTDALFDWVNTIEEFNFQEKGVHFDKNQLDQILEKKYPRYVANQTEFDANFTTCLSTSNTFNANMTPGYSAIYYSPYPDQLNHAYSKAHAYNFYSFFRISKLFVQVIKYIQKYAQDTVLFISSDHGGQFFNGEDNFCNHGCASDSNQGVLIIASNDTIGNGQSNDINYLDLLPTISQYLEGINLPLFNRGIGNPMRQNDFASQILPLHQKFIQLKQFFKKIYNEDLKKEYDLESKYNTILKNNTLTKEQKQDVIDDYVKITSKLQNKVIKLERSKKDFTLPNLLKVVLFVGLIYVVLFNFKIALKEWKELQLLQKILIAIILFMYYSDNILVIYLQKQGNDFYHNSFYINIICTILLLVFFSFFDFSSKTNKQFQLSFHKSDNRQDDFEKQSFSHQYEQVGVGSSDSLDMFKNGNTSEDSQSKFHSIIAKIKKLPQKYNRKSDQYLSLNKCLLIILALNLVYELFIQFDLFVYSKKFYMETMSKWHILNVMNYGVFIIFYLYPKMKPLGINLRYLVRKTNNQIFMCRFIALYSLIGLLYNSRRAYILLKQDKEEKKNSSLSIFSYQTRDTQSPAYNAQKKFFTLIHADISILVFYISDEVERVYLVFLFFTLIFISNKMNAILNNILAQNTKGLFNTFIAQLFITVIIFKNLQFIYTAFKGTLSLDINLQAGNKTIGEVQDATPIYTAILFGIDKMLIMILGYMEIIQLFFRVQIKENTIKFDNATKGLAAMIIIKLLITGIQLCFNFFDEDYFLSLFIWFASMSVIILICFLPYSIFKLVFWINAILDAPKIKKSQHLSV